MLMGVHNGAICTRSNLVISPNVHMRSLQGIHLKLDSHDVQKEIRMDISSRLLVAALFVMPKAVRMSPIRVLAEYTVVYPYNRL